MSEFFVNDKYKVLECMANRQIPVNNAQIIKLSQQEIADMLSSLITEHRGYEAKLKTFKKVLREYCQEMGYI